MTENSESAENGSGEKTEDKNEDSMDGESKTDSTEKMDTSEVCVKQNNAVGETVSIEKTSE